MKKYVCDVCRYIYDPAVGDPDNGIAPGTAFEDIPDDWVCPLCGLCSRGVITPYHYLYVALPSWVKPCFILYYAKKPVLLKMKVSTTALRYQ